MVVCFADVIQNDFHIQLKKFTLHTSNYRKFNFQLFTFQIELVVEQTDSCERHSDIVLIAGVDNVVVTD